MCDTFLATMSRLRRTTCFRRSDKSILLVTEGLGPQKFHGRVVILVNEHTASAGEMLASFAEENNLATIVGVKTAGRLLSGSIFRAGEGYIVGLPVAAYLTWQGRLIEGKGVSPRRSSRDIPGGTDWLVKIRRCRKPCKLQKTCASRRPKDSFMHQNRHGGRLKPHVVL